jgi:hypothetical protein
MKDQSPEIVYQRSKYLTRNPISRRLIDGFRSCLISMARELDAQHPVRSLAEFGCGEGISMSWMKTAFPSARGLGFDIHIPSAQIAPTVEPHAVYAVGDVTHAPLASRSADLVFMLEVMEHLSDPLTALCEAERVSRRWCILSVPREPLWRMLNMARGAYWGARGNTPGHVNHWSRRSFVCFVSRHMDVVQVLTPAPWTMVACRIRS